MRLTAPLIDLRSDTSQPMRFYGFRIDRAGTVHATTTRMTHGRTNKNYEVVVGSVKRSGRNWIARAKDGAEHTEATQDRAGRWLERYTEDHQG